MRLGSHSARSTMAAFGLHPESGSPTSTGDDCCELVTDNPLLSSPAVSCPYPLLQSQSANGSSAGGGPEAVQRGPVLQEVVFNMFPRSIVAGHGLGPRYACRARGLYSTA
ncbi:hypothetical protein FOZ63_023956 [Perkinsus olseni]|uniref:Uncharacterized protein n=1 Tax=Perkinsus olseni TaxID=32597 RepID=A0A7J6T5G4_PEROL|nr:hypothetical protein FOZ63_023956 [Perkinsus olseni]